MGDAVEPLREVGLGLDGVSFFEEDEESGLEGVFGVGGVLEDALADIENHRAVTAGDELEGGGIFLEERGEEVSVGERGWGVGRFHGLWSC